jgi:hypothetical protein
VVTAHIIVISIWIGIKSPRVIVQTMRMFNVICNMVVLGIYTVLYYIEPALHPPIDC